MGNILNGLLASDRLKCVDVGSRGGLQDHWLRFMRFIETDALEPDTDACAVSQTKAPPNEHWFPIGLAGHTGMAKLYILNKPSGSSLYPPNPVVNDLYAPWGYGRLEKIIDIPVMTFSAFIEQNRRPLPNLIKLDTQGSELDILRSLKPEHWRDVLAIQVEVEFIEYYIGQPLFEQVDSFLRAKGLEFYDLLGQRVYRVKDDVEQYYLRKYLGLTKHRRDISCRMVAADALYFRSPAEVIDRRDLSMSMKLLLILIIYRFFDEALWVIEALQASGQVTAEQAHSLISEVRTSAPKPTLLQRADWLGKLSRRFSKKLNIGRKRKIEYWLHRKWDF
jgi:FkbM family methyltransferase